jgi:hypothetical protein
VVQGIAKQLVRALHYLHSNRIIHRCVLVRGCVLACCAVQSVLGWQHHSPWLVPCMRLRLGAHTHQSQSINTHAPNAET